MSTERVIAHRSVADALVDKLAEKARTLVAGAPTAKDAKLGAILTSAGTSTHLDVTLRWSGTEPTPPS